MIGLLLDEHISPALVGSLANLRHVCSIRAARRLSRSNVTVRYGNMHLITISRL